MTGVIVVDGCEGSGHEDLAKRIADRYRAETRNDASIVLRFHLNDFDQAAFAVECAQKSPHLAIMVGSWISDVIHDPAFGASARALHRQLLHLGAFYVLCAPDPEYIVSRIAGEELRRPDITERIRSARETASRFYALARGDRSRPVDGDYVDQLAHQGGVKGHANWYRYDIERKHADTRMLPKTLIEMARTRFNWRRQPPEGCPSWDWGMMTGSPNAEVALVCSEDAECPPLMGSRFFNEALHKAAVPEGLIAIVNERAFPDDGHVRETLKPFRRWVALEIPHAGPCPVNDRVPCIQAAILPPSVAEKYRTVGQYAADLSAVINGTAS